ncbi:MAG: imidazole glycerol phosphate synthase subunit HisH [Prevotella sp.]|nr:imidazole glycerol phosphate synthase subunit HisH [Prevotella sp.]MCI1281750.1 imidazole glycerol phosphate synthase subunit HisH [Prevotella sp.]
MKVAIVKYNAGNIYSVVNALRRIGVEPILTDKAEDLMSADKVLFPGQGEASTTMAYIHEHRLDEIIRNLKQPVLGICIGQQLLCQHSEEGDTECIGVFPVDVKRFQPQRHEEKVPAMGWNEINLTKDQHQGENALLKDIGEEPYVYFVHSYYVPLCDWTIAKASYILPFSAALHKDNFYSTQFHPEKSGKVGEQILKNFLEL